MWSWLRRGAFLLIYLALSHSLHIQKNLKQKNKHSILNLSLYWFYIHKYHCFSSSNVITNGLQKLWFVVLAKWPSMQADMERKTIQKDFPHISHRIYTFTTVDLIQSHWRANEVLWVGTCSFCKWENHWSSETSKEAPNNLLGCLRCQHQKNHKKPFGRNNNLQLHQKHLGSWPLVIVNCYIAYTSCFQEHQ